MAERGQTLLNYKDRIGTLPGVYPMYPTAGQNFYTIPLDADIHDETKQYFLNKLQPDEFPSEKVPTHYPKKKYPFVSPRTPRADESEYITEKDTSSTIYSAGNTRTLPLRSKNTIFWAYFAIAAIVGFICGMILISNSEFIRKIQKHKDHPGFSILLLGWIFSIIILATFAYNIYFLASKDRIIYIINLLLGISMLLLIIWTFSFADQKRPDIAIYWGIAFTLAITLLLLYTWSTSKFWSLMLVIVVLWSIWTLLYMFHLKIKKNEIEYLIKEPPNNPIPFINPSLKKKYRHKSKK
jgi:tryptophan-rich sensory protein